jgi:hypothetical protein
MNNGLVFWCHANLSLCCLFVFIKGAPTLCCLLQETVCGPIFLGTENTTCELMNECGRLDSAYKRGQLVFEVNF